MAVDRLEAFLKVLTAVCEWELTPQEHKALVERFAELLQPTGYYAASIPLRRALREAAQRAGWHLRSPKIQQRQKVAARGRTNQREEDLALRRLMVAAPVQTAVTPPPKRTRLHGDRSGNHRWT